MTDSGTEAAPTELNAPEFRVPRWLREIDGSLAVTSQFILTGNVRDSFLISGEASAQPARLLEALWQVLKESGFQTLLVYDIVDGLRCYPSVELDPKAHEVAESLVGNAIGTQLSIERLRSEMTKVVAQNTVRAAFVVDYADRLISDGSQLSEPERMLFTAAQKLSHNAQTVRTPEGIERKTGLFNPVFWIAGSERDLPSWLYAGNGRVRVVPIPLPDLTERNQFAARLAPGLAGFSDLPGDQSSDVIESLSESTEGLTADGMMDVTRLAVDQKVQVREIDDAARLYRVGVNENPWKQEGIRARINGGQEIIESRVRGQGDAVHKALDILVRSATGLTGAQVSAQSTRPRGVLFFAGPTGVGKTEFAKALTELIFGDERAYIRLDMSEYSAEQAEARLVGSPPGYVGHDAGGQLTEAVRRRPFSLVLFDEIEKAHPRILDKFLQVLDDGRLTDGAGTTVHFSETILVFTSNLGISVIDKNGNRVPNVTREDPRDVFEEKIREAVSAHFITELGRPELLNRFGDNIVVFDFIDEATGGQIFDIQLRNVTSRILQEYRAVLEIDPAVRAKLLAAALENLDLGGRGLGSVLESALVNPLARALFANPPERDSVVRVVDCSSNGRIWELTLA
ncbi:MAG: AAA family ATPase [Actinomycetia bacterium]|nr:AAA family ATPase [Actinomycetes bacterium]